MLMRGGSVHGENARADCVKGRLMARRIYPRSGNVVYFHTQILR